MTQNNTTDFIAYQSGHDHSRCINEAMFEAQTICKNNGQRLTKIRALVLQLIWQSHKSLGAYELLPEIAKAGFNSAPPTVYRALEFLQEQGLVHRLASLNAFIGCSHPGQQHAGYFLICKACGIALELDSKEIQHSIKHCTVKMGFTVEQENVEILGCCANCSEAAWDQ